MGKYVQGFDVNQISFLPLSFDEMIDEDNVVRGISAIVDIMDKDKLNFTHTQTKKTGRPPYDPISMFKAYLYCYYNAIRSSRRIERECKRNIELMWLIGGLAPDHKTIAEFRKNNKKAIQEAHKEFIRICNELKLLGKEVVAVDGTKIRANNSRKNNVTISKLNKMIEHHNESIHDYLKKLAENDIAEDTSTIKSKLKKAQEKKLECEKLISEMENEGVREKSLIDPDSHQMGVSNKGTDIAYNVQNVVDSKEHIIVTTDVVTSPADQTQLYAMSEKMIEELKITENVKVLADKGYWRIDDLVKCHQNEHIEAIVAVPKEQGNPGFRKSDFLYNAEKDEYMCPMGKILTRWKGKSATYTNSKACKGCPNRDKCTKNKQGRQIVRNESEQIIEEAAERYKTKIELYKLRQQLVEHPFGTIKRSLGFTYFLLRRLEKVKIENFLHVITYNLKRVLSIFSVPDLVERLKRIKEQEEQKKALNHCIDSAFFRLLRILFIFIRNIVGFT